MKTTFAQSPCRWGGHEAGFWLVGDEGKGYFLSCCLTVGVGGGPHGPWVKVTPQGWRGHRREGIWAPEPQEPGTPGLLGERNERLLFKAPSTGLHSGRS